MSTPALTTSAPPLSRTDFTHQKLRAMAHVLGPGKKLPTCIDLRASLDVSKITLDRALAQLERERVITRRRGSGLYVAATLSKKIALICDPAPFRASGHSPFWDMFIRIATERSATSHEEISFHFTNLAGGGDLLQSGLKADVSAGRINGVIGVALGQAEVDWLNEAGQPLVTLFTHSRHVVGVDTRELIRQGVHALAQRGCRSLGFWTPCVQFEPLEQSLAMARWDLRAFREALKDVGLPFDEALLRQSASRRKELAEFGGAWDYPDREQGYRAALEAFAPGAAKRPDGILVASDNMTQGILPALARLGLQVGRDLEVATHANAGSPTLLGHEQELILLEFSPQEMVECVFGTLEELMAGRRPASDKILVQPRLRWPEG